MIFERPFDIDANLKLRRGSNFLFRTMVPLELVGLETFMQVLDNSILMDGLLIHSLASNTVIDPNMNGRTNYQI